MEMEFIITRTDTNENIKISREQLCMILDALSQYAEMSPEKRRISIPENKGIGRLDVWDLENLIHWGLQGK